MSDRVILLDDVQVARLLKLQDRVLARIAREEALASSTGSLEGKVAS